MSDKTPQDDVQTLSRTLDLLQSILEERDPQTPMQLQLFAKARSALSRITPMVRLSEDAAHVDGKRLHYIFNDETDVANLQALGRQWIDTAARLGAEVVNLRAPLVCEEYDDSAKEALLLLQARYVLKDLHFKDDSCGYAKMAYACELAAARAKEHSQ